MLHKIDEDKEPLRKLLADIEEFCERKGMSHTQFGKLSPAKDGHFVRRLRDGKDILVTSEAAVRRFMRTHKGSQPK